MRLTFTARKPQPCKSGAAPLGEVPAKPAARPQQPSKELGGPSGPEPTRYGDWERKGICVDF
ncbi:MAG TPA: succinate dehydrogenase assembly factor 4 [Kiloniellaceae bacterium]